MVWRPEEPACFGATEKSATAADCRYKWFLLSALDGKFPAVAVGVVKPYAHVR
jgi:hypothetical protein